MQNKEAKIGIIDYGLGNIFTIESAINFLGYQNTVSVQEQDDLLTCDKLILPGVGSFQKGVELLDKMKLSEPLIDCVNTERKHLLGICLGMQLLFESSSEGGGSHGLGILKGSVSKFGESVKKIPHMGFNNLIYTGNESVLLSVNIRDNPDFYFTHSYKINDFSEGDFAYCEYGERFVALVEKENIFGVQFHPELSQQNGLHLLSNFLEY
jgi:imidazole glycerol-phosphate synthase subunit HisH